MTDNAPYIQVADLTVAYQRKPVLWEISLDIPKGALVGLVGPNGAGKSTLLKAMLNMVSRVSGEISLGGLPMLEQRENRICSTTRIGRLGFSSFGARCGHDGTLSKDRLVYACS